eukprot:gene4261-3082_t
MSTARRDTLMAIEKAAQEQWEAKKLNEWDAPPPSEQPPEKFFTTFPFPYMNGRLHLGHAFSLTKSEFASRFERMMGKRSLWAFAFHVTGMPIAACAKKIRTEMELYGNPPQFPPELLGDSATPPPPAQGQPAPQGKFKSKRGKAGPAKPQWLIMKQLGIPDEEIPKFADPHYWLNYFPPFGIEDLKYFGCHIDFRRTFATTERCPYFDRFVRWQFDQLYEKKLLNYGKRYCVYSPVDGQPCADHDRASGEGVLPQEYTVTKLAVQNPQDLEVFQPFSNVIGNCRVIFPCATLRPETLVGQTNCWVSPNFPYKAYKVQNQKGEEEVFLMTSRAARNLAYQDFTVNGKKNVDPEPLFEIDGAKLIGIPLSAPLCVYKTIFTLPMATISETKGTGVVMSVPSDSPDDFINYTQLLNKPDYRIKLGIKDEWVLPFAMIPIIDIPDLGVEGAKFMCEKLKINGPNAKDLLEEAKKVCYQKGFYYGTMITGPYKGQRVSDAKVASQKSLVENDDAIVYYEPTGMVTSRSGDECVVALQNQWYIEYGKNEEWKKAVLEHLESVNTFFPSVRNGFEETLNWLSEWPCSRTFGLGTYLPSDPTHTMLIDSLSDSTIYMAYYTISKFLHIDTDDNFMLFADRPNKYGLKPEMFTRETFDYIYHGKGEAVEVAAKVGMPVDILQSMRNEFCYWYPVDLRCSGKDLIQNHLTMFLYNHAAIWSDDRSKWPRGIFCNGHVQVDNEKMAKSKGNFISLREAIETYGSDATRLACADAGDTLDDANFVRETASGFVLKLTTVIQQAQEALEDTSLRSGEFVMFDRIFSNVINEIIVKTKGHYQSMQYRLVLNCAFHEFTTEFSQYKQFTDNDVHKDLVRRFYEVFALLLMPLAPHFSEHLWQNVLQMEGNVVTQPFPVCDAPSNFALKVSHRIIKDVTKEIRAQVTKLSKKRGNIDAAVVYVATEYAYWQKKVLVMLREIYDQNEQTIPATVSKIVLHSSPETMAFLNFMRAHVENYGVDALNVDPAVNDYELLSGITANLAKLSGVAAVEVLQSTDTKYDEHKVTRSRSRPGEPSVAFPPAPKA